MNNYILPLFDKSLKECNCCTNKTKTSKSLSLDYVKASAVRTLRSLLVQFFINLIILPLKKSKVERKKNEKELDFQVNKKVKESL